MGYGHGTLITGQDAQGVCSVYVSDNGGDNKIKANSTQDAIVQDGVSAEKGDVVDLGWSESKNSITVEGIGTRATGDVNSGGTKISITKSGDTSLSGDIAISSTYGSNSGFNSQKGITCGNVDGEAAFLE